MLKRSAKTDFMQSVILPEKVRFDYKKVSSVLCLSNAKEKKRYA